MIIFVHIEKESKPQQLMYNWIHSNSTLEVLFQFTIQFFLETSANQMIHFEFLSNLTA